MMESPKLNTRESSEFCTYENIKSASVYLSQELQNLGIRCKIIEANGEKLNILSLINSCWHLTQLYAKAIKDGNNLHDQRCRDTADLNHVQASIRDLRETLEEKERYVQEITEKDRQISNINQALATKLKNEKEEVKKLNHFLQQKEDQHHHEIKKRELECAMLKERLLRLVSGERSNRSSSLNMTGSLDRNHKLRTLWKTEGTTVKHEEDLYRKIFARYEGWIEQLTEEIGLLKDFISTMTCKTRKVANKCLQSVVEKLIQEKESLSSSSVSDDSLEGDPIMKLPFGGLKDKITRSFEEDLYVIESELERKASSTDADADNATIGLQEELLAEGLCVEQKERLSQEYRKLKTDKMELAREQKKIRDLALKLNKEKCALELEKVELLRAQFLNELPDNLEESNHLQCGRSYSLTHLYGDSPRRVQSNPSLTVVKGDVDQKDHITTLALPKARPRRSGATSRNRASRESSLNSAPSSRTPSLNRLHEPKKDLRISQSAYTSKSRTSSAPHSPKICDRMTFPRSSPSDIPMRNSLNSMTSSESSSTMANMDWKQSSDLPSIDSGFVHEQDGATSSRLDVLETSLKLLIDKIAYPKSDTTSARPASFYRDSRETIFSDYQFNAPSGCSTPMVPSRRNVSDSSTSLISAPASMRSSRRTSADLSASIDHLKNAR